MAFYYFDYYNTQHITYSPHLKMKHFLDLLRTFWLPPSEKIPKRGNDVVKHLHSATQLHEAGLANLVNSLVENVIYVDMNSNFYRVCKDLKAFYKKPWNRWQATLRRDYFSSPWSIASTVVALIFLVLTLLQTIYTVKV
ncbi:hypothetical protein CFP56_028634 [Quercus suber]|uniref:Uncharacterized protein n=1 Tax=Quercus suber TaxID=58331 RepID=A0AAW0JS91_QUESU